MALLAAGGPLAKLLHHKRAAVQAGGNIAVVSDGHVRLEMEAHYVQPAITQLEPPAVHAGPDLVWTVELHGRSVALPSVVLCRQRGRHLAVEVHACAESDGEQAQEWVRIWPLGLAPGYAELEVQAGNLLSAPRPLLVLPNAAATAEVNALAAAAPVTPSAAATIDAFLREVGLVVGWTHRHESAPAAGLPPPDSPTLLRSVASTARRLVPVVAARGAAALAALLLEGACVDGCSAAKALAAMDASCPASLLHVAAGSGSTAVIAALHGWGARHGLRWELQATAAGSCWEPVLSPLHVAAVLPDCNAMRQALASLDPEGARKQWAAPMPGGGPSPAQLSSAAEEQLAILACLQEVAAYGDTGSMQTYCNCCGADVCCNCNGGGKIDDPEVEEMCHTAHSDAVSAQDWLLNERSRAEAKAAVKSRAMKGEVGSYAAS